MHWGSFYWLIGSLWFWNLSAAKKDKKHVLHLYTVQILEYNQQRKLSPVQGDKEGVIQGVIW